MLRTWKHLCAIKKESFEAYTVQQLQDLYKVKDIINITTQDS